MPSPVWVGTIQFLEGLNRTEKGRQNSFPLWLTAWAGTFIFSCPQTATYTIASPDSQDFELGLELHHWFSWISKLQMAYFKILSLHNHACWFFVISLYLSTYLYIYLYLYIHSIFGEPYLIWINPKRIALISIYSK